MLTERIIQIRNSIKENKPLIHCITNPISINQCANAVLAVGCRPIMAEHPAEVGEITPTASSLLINLGNITDVRMQSMRISADEAHKNKIPVVLDAVGAACSKLRRDFVHELIESHMPAVIKGNYSEINALLSGTYQSSGVDSDSALDTAGMISAVGKLSQQYGCIILASGKTDIISDGKTLLCINNGTKQLASVTGTGCMLGALTACCLSAVADIGAAAAACAVLGICGELSRTADGNGSFMVNLIDRLSVLTEADIVERLKMEEMQIEKI